MSDTELSHYSDLWAEKHKDAADRATAELRGMRDDTDRELEELKDTWDEKVREIDENLQQTLKDIENDFKKSVGIIKTDTAAEFGDMTKVVSDILTQAGWDQNGIQIGSDIVNGIATGINNTRSFLENTMAGLVDYHVQVTRKAYDSHSPSRVFAKIGNDLTDGIAVGMVEYKSVLSDAASDVGNSAIDVLGRTIGNISALVDENLDTAPVISPVVDFGNVDRGLRYINDSFGLGRSMELAYAIQNGSKNKDDSMSRIADINERSYDKIAGAIDGLRTDFDTLLTKVNNLQVVMNTGALVGAITPEMNRSLGSVAAMNRRRSR